MAKIIYGDSLPLLDPVEHQEKMEKALRDCLYAIDEYGRELQTRKR